MSKQEKAIDKLHRIKSKEETHLYKLKIMIISWYALGIMLMLPGIYYNDLLVFCFGAGFFFLATAFIGLCLLAGLQL